MKELRVGEPVLVTAGIPSFEGQSGRIVQIMEPFVRSEHMKSEALREMPLYLVRFDDGRKFRFRGRDLQPLDTFNCDKRPVRENLHMRSV